MKRLLAFALGIALATPSSPVYGVTLPYSFNPASTIRASEVNANFGALRDAINNHESAANPHNTDLAEILLLGNGVGGTPIDFELTQGLDFRVENLSADPTCNAGSRGRLIWNTTDSLFKVCNGSSYVSIAGTGVNTLASVLSAGNSAGASNINLNGNQLLAARVENVAVDPTPGNIGRLIFNTVSSTLKVDTGAILQSIGGAQGLASVLGVSNSAGSTNIDFNGNQAVNMRLENLASNPGTTTAGRAYYNTASGKPFYYDGVAATWKEIGNTNTLAQTLALGNSAGASNIDLNQNQLIRARAENLVAPPGSGNAGRLYFDTGSSQLGYDTGVANKFVCSLDDAQTLTNKTISGLANTITNVPDSALSANVALLNSTQTISGAKTFSTAPTIDRIQTTAGTVTGHEIPNGLVDDTFVLANAVQTLAGKTLNAPALSGNIDFNLFQAQEFRVENLAADPAASAGRVFYKTTTGELLYSNGTSWFALGVNTTPTWDTVLAAGNSAGGNDVDINNNQLLNVRIQNVGALPANGNVGRVVYNTADGRLYGDTGAAWLNVGAQNLTEVLTMGNSAGTFDINFNQNEALAMRLENLGSDPGFGNPGRLFYNTTDLAVKFDNGTAIIPFLDAASTATLTNKTISGTNNTLSNIADSSLVEDYVLADGSRALTANWNAGAFQITANGVQVGSAANTIRSLTSIDNAGFVLNIPTGVNDTLVARATTDTLTNKTIDADQNTISNIENADIKAGAAISRNKLASGTADHVLINDGTGVMSSEAQLAVSRGGTGLGTAPTNGQLLVGNGTGYTLATITGTANRVTVTNGAGTITLSGPQDLDSAASPTFANQTLSGFLATQRRDESAAATINSLAVTQGYVKLTATVTTINGAAAGANGQQLIINNSTGSQVTINHESASAVAADRFSLPGARAILMQSGESATFIYDTGASRWVQAGGGSGGGAIVAVGSRATPSNIVAGTGITGLTAQRNLAFVQGSAGAVTVTANPAVSGCATAADVGKEAILVGRSDTNTLTLNNGNGLELNGPATLGASDVLSLLCDGTAWVEASRSM